MGLSGIQISSCFEDELQGLRRADLPRVRHEPAAGRRSSAVPARLRGVQAEARRGLRRRHPHRRDRRGEGAFKIGGETVLFRHEKTFVNPAGLAMLVSDDEPEAAVDGKLRRFKRPPLRPRGLVLKGNAVAVKARRATRRVRRARREGEAATEGRSSSWRSRPRYGRGRQGLRDRKPLCTPRPRQRRRHGRAGQGGQAPARVKARICRAGALAEKLAPRRAGPRARPRRPADRKALHDQINPRDGDQPEVRRSAIRRSSPCEMTADR